MKNKKIFFALLIVLLLLVGTMTVAHDPCDNPSCWSALDRGCKLACTFSEDCTWWIYGAGVCVHGMCQFEVTYYCLGTGDPVSVTIMCSGSCPL